MTYRQENYQREMESSSKVILESKRLYLRKLTESDLPFLLSIDQDPEVMKYIGPIRNEAEIKARLEITLNKYRSRPGYGRWMACKKSGEEPIGWACLKDLDGSRMIELGYRLSLQEWGQGYATEISRALVKYGFTERNLEEIVAVTHPLNTASQKVLLKAGLTYEKNAYYYQNPVRFYSIRRIQWSSSTK